MSTITTDSITGHEGTNDDSNHAENEKRNSKSDLFDRRAIIDGEWRIHHNVFVCYGKRMIHIRHFWEKKALEVRSVEKECRIGEEDGSGGGGGGGGGR